MACDEVASGERSDGERTDCGLTAVPIDATILGVEQQILGREELWKAGPGRQPEGRPRRPTGQAPSPAFWPATLWRYR